MKRRKKTPTSVINVPTKYLEDVAGLIRSLKERDIPRKPIKRVRKLSPAELKEIRDDLKTMTKQVRRLEKEYERLDYLSDDDEMRPSDTRWLDSYKKQLYKTAESGLEIAGILNDII